MPVCPHCEGQVTIDIELYESSPSDGVREVLREVKGILRKEIMYSCPHCDHVLGFGYFEGGLLTGRP